VPVQKVFPVGQKTLKEKLKRINYGKERGSDENEEK